ncbi:bifunctional diaminohydroxyphosphoribosylaminopyrimidine deaminase/5-amino-6-(5-phosphoribosylamino)uracil reductase RibD [Moraxella sp.]|uniref:bifunctional diaminohydroxyphosphoribosylaminopyrimidine deaminase/5-amino-6-(5-phosphoribosylamino)uracil reductase RibD n=1 Tax=Moraxella sp. TaxID=479 RepID=UPI0026DA83A8|nr:bifunctional diaminohydroxyphosphoribosylaminopyrimidine deaminase/5-amino-6-(5-phosphoribosylamino)uracil reductase RibD [Moraxella sp.]MDO4894873.1 bifunctional diaminohydroxyphosphoribosylaminopyrimidine deaminase/5-amino-6-(5-phosphoribosylamino)uracil reductase RibD [Moraxella sp.]
MDGQILPHDAYYMGLAIALAKKGEFTTRPNPAVGCVLVKDGRIIGEGFHPKAGEPHAEVFALRHANQQGHDVTGATAYVTLEPCSHTGRTPPCADTLVQAGIARVVIACTDSNPKVSGGGIAKLQQAGIAVTVGVAHQQAAALNRGFLKAMATGMPYVRLKIATSLDGKVVMANGESKWITGDEAREDVQKLRAKSAAIITGSGTIIADNPSLTVRSTQLGVPACHVPSPKIVVLDRSKTLSHSMDYQVFCNPNTMIWHQDIHSLLALLVQEHQCHDVLVEAGAKVAGAFIEADLVDELIVYQAPSILGAKAVSMFDFDVGRLDNQRRFTLSEMTKIGEDVKLVYHKLY